MSNVVYIISGVFCLIITLVVGIALGSDWSRQAEAIAYRAYETERCDAIALMKCCPQCQQERQEQAS